MSRSTRYRSLWLVLLFLLAACAVPAATSTPATIPVATQAIANTAVATSAPQPSPSTMSVPTPPPSATAMPKPSTPIGVAPTPTIVRLVSTDSDRQCQMTIPSGFAEDTPGSGYFPALDKTGFVTVEAPDTADGANSFDQAVGMVLVTLVTVLPGYRQTNVARSPDTLRVDFTAPVDTGTGKGVAYFKRYGTIICGATLFLTNRSVSPFDATLRGMVATLQVVEGALPRPTATPVPSLP